VRFTGFAREWLGSKTVSTEERPVRYIVRQYAVLVSGVRSWRRLPAVSIVARAASM
jgi:hypothetical protein